MTICNEGSYENAVLYLLETLGYEHLHGPNIDRDYRAPFDEAQLAHSPQPVNPTKPAGERIVIRDARPEDAPFLAQCLLSGMHLYDFEEEMSPETEKIHHRLCECERRDDLIYSHTRCRIAEVNGEAAGSLLSYPGCIYREGRRKTFAEISPDLAEMERTSDQETDPDEYYLDTLAVLPKFRRRGIGRMLLEDGIRKGSGLGYKKIALVADSEYPHLISLYESIGFTPADHRRAFGVDFQRMIYTV